MISTDLRLGIRALRRSPGFTVAAALTLALGIGLSTAVFTVANTLLVRRLPVADQGRLVALWGETPRGDVTNIALRYDETQAFTRASRALADVAFFGYEGAWSKPVTDGDRALDLRRALVSGNFFSTLGSRAEIGRPLRAEDDIVGAPLVVVLSHQAWMRDFAGDSAVLGRSLAMEPTGRLYRVVGVMPPGLDFPRGTEMWQPLVATSAGTGDSLHLVSGALDLVGRLRPGASAKDAAAELSAFFARADATPLERGVHATAHSLPDLVLGDARPALLAFGAAAALLLLLTAVNVANLVLVRGLGRVRELAVRTALGASRGRVVQQLAVESLVLAVLGAVGGVIVAGGAIRVFVAVAPAGVPRLDEIAVGRGMLAVATGVTALAALLFAIAPALVTSRVDAQEALRAGSRPGIGSRRSRTTRDVLVAVQVALAMVILSCAGLVARSLMKLEHVDLAYDPHRIVVGELLMRPDAATSKAARIALVQRIAERVATLPNVEAVSPVLVSPFTGSGGIRGRLATPAQAADEIAHNPVVDFDVVGPDYFRTLALRLVRGRAFSHADGAGAPAAVVVSESVARFYWPGADPLGQRLSGGSAGEFTVVGVVPDAHYREYREASPTVYFPLAQSPFPVDGTTLLIRSRGPAGTLAQGVRAAVADMHAGVTVTSTTSFGTLLDAPLAEPRLNALLLGMFAVTAVLLAGVGLFGAITLTVRQRRRELGIRLALGATRGSVRRLVAGRGVAIAASGVAAGLIGAVVLSRLLSTLLFHVEPTDALTLGVTSALILGVALVASLIPAQASARIDPAAVLRDDL